MLVFALNVLAARFTTRWDLTPGASTACRPPPWRRSVPSTTPSTSSSFWGGATR
ncbi:MAG: hypothetical protein MZV70_36495 [Desulfobacterales bacterium]|nr:hypothetical protein [Desulfobacterales bacterium]